MLTFKFSNSFVHKSYTWKLGECNHIERDKFSFLFRKLDHRLEMRFEGDYFLVLACKP